MKIIDFIETLPLPMRNTVKREFFGFSKSSSVQVLHVPAGEVVFLQETPLKAIYVLIEGQATAFSNQSSYISYAFSDFSPIELFGESEALSGAPTTFAEIKAKTDCTFILISIKDYMAWVMSDVQIMHTRVSRMLRQLLVQASEERNALFQPSAYRLTSFLIDYFEEHDQGDPFLVVQQTQYMIAEQIGFGTRTVGRGIRELVQRGYITLYRGKVKISRVQYEKLKLKLKQENPDNT